ncbi:hypothetical protein TSOC_008108 [Tetrabaena socialis]|uniref:Uncharacterized protein n=1 Tax=Tetrabaena socialis TaxID=47790 RepID=A0A2J7ZZA2_9CHLO|nr:hypothetical protein TSOC_008108 [Tetrabaena socialis]|eukprot:PNH05601.1 hypothetical protein TSOC_008108 [Tetrabaena socialis]
MPLPRQPPHEQVTRRRPTDPTCTLLLAFFLVGVGVMSYLAMAAAACVVAGVSAEMKKATKRSISGSMKKSTSSGTSTTVARTRRSSLSYCWAERLECRCASCTAAAAETAVVSAAVKKRVHAEWDQVSHEAARMCRVL